MMLKSIPQGRKSLKYRPEVAASGILPNSGASRPRKRRLIPFAKAAGCQVSNLFFVLLFSPAPHSKPQPKSHQSHLQLLSPLHCRFSALHNPKMFRWRKPLLVMYDDNYRYGTNLYVPTVNSLDSRGRDYYIPMLPPPSALAPPPRVSLVDYDLYAPISFGYGRSLLKPRTPASKGEPTPKSRMSSRYYPYYYGLEGL